MTIQTVEPGFLDLPEELAAYRRARFAVLPVPYDATVSYGTGTRHGPAAIIAASHQMEWYDEEVGISAAEEGICTLRGVEPVVTGPADYLRKVEEQGRALVDDGKVLVGLGGEHSVTYALCRAARARWPDITVVQLDAHMDLRDEYQGSPHSHACVMRRLLDEGLPVVQVGVRSGCQEEWELARARDIPCFPARELADEPITSWVDRVVEAIPTPLVYLTIDLDGMDPSVVPGTGTPEPGGISFWAACRLFREIAARRQVVAFDVMELEPQPGSRVSDYAAARLTYKVMSYMSAGGSGGG